MKVELTPTNMLLRTFMHWRHHMVGTKQGANFRQVLISMLGTGKYFSRSKWLAQSNGLSEDPAESLWLLLIRTPSTEPRPKDVTNVFLHGSSRPFVSQEIPTRPKYFADGDPGPTIARHPIGWRIWQGVCDHDVNKTLHTQIAAFKELWRLGMETNH